MKSYELFNETSQAIFYNLKSLPIQVMLDFDYLSGRKLQSVVAVVHPGRSGFHKAFFGNDEILIPIYSTISEAVEKHPKVDCLVNFASFRSAYTATLQALNAESIRTVAIVAEGMPEQESKDLIRLAKKKNKMIIGPSTVGGIVAGKFRIGHAGGMNDNIIRAKLYRPGSVGVVSKSGGMMNELFNIVARAADGIYEGLAIGGDKFPGSTLLEHVLRFEANPNIKMIVAFGELGGISEYEIAQAKKAEKITKPIVMWVSGTSADIFPWEVQFGHAGAKASKKEESAVAKNEVLRNSGVLVPKSFDELESLIARTYDTLVKSCEIKPVKEPTIPTINANRYNSTIVSTISDDREDLEYLGVKIDKLVTDGKGIGDVIGLLWFKKHLPKNFSKFLELCIILTADHGPAVSGAHNAIVTSRAGKDTISSLCSGLLTIGPRFGGAIDGACRYFKEVCDSNRSPVDFVNEMKAKGILIPGIGHRVKSKKNPDKRVEVLKEFAMKELKESRYLKYALDVEKITLKKAENLILNVDGCIAAIFLDVIHESKLFSRKEIKQILEIGYMNGLFALARSIGIIGHSLDQKRLGERLYRHSTDDIFYVK